MQALPDPSAPLQRHFSPRREARKFAMKIKVGLRNDADPKPADDRGLNREQALRIRENNFPQILIRENPRPPRGEAQRARFS
jgi:hypothetical protein